MEHAISSKSTRKHVCSLAGMTTVDLPETFPSEDVGNWHHTPPDRSMHMTNTSSQHSLWEVFRCSQSNAIVGAVQKCRTGACYLFVNQAMLREWSPLHVPPHCAKYIASPPHFWARLAGHGFVRTGALRGFVIAYRTQGWHKESTMDNGWVHIPLEIPWILALRLAAGGHVLPRAG